MRLGGWASEYVAAHTPEEIVDAVRHADAQGSPVLVIGEGSNLVVGDQGFDGVVVHAKAQAVAVNGGRVHAEAGAPWDPLVALSVDAGLGGLEPLSGIPGTAGGTPIQNVGAYGALVSSFLTHVTVYDRIAGATRDIAAVDCGFGSHRRSIFKRSGRFVILSVHFDLPRTRASQPITYAALAGRLGLAAHDTAPTRDVRDAVLELRRERGMLVDVDDHDTWSVGSFFVNPVLRHVPVKAEGCPTYPDAAGTKLSAAWLIDHAGFPPGYGQECGRGRVRLSTKHALAVTNRGGATTSEVMAFAAHICDGVERTFDVRLGPECDLVNCSFDDPVSVGPRHRDSAQSELDVLRQ